MGDNSTMAWEIDHTITRLKKVLARNDADLNTVRLECDTLVQQIGKFIPYKHHDTAEDLGATQNPVLMYDATVTLEFLPDGEQVLRVALADQTEPVLINKRGDESFEGDEWQHHTNLANKWLQIDYHITTHKED